MEENLFNPGSMPAIVNTVFNAVGVRIRNLLITLEKALKKINI